MSRVTQLLESLEGGKSQASEELLPLVYDQLRQLASARMSKLPAGQTLQATALVHEAWIRLAGSGSEEWEGRYHFFAAAAEAMRRILIENARRRGRECRGGDRQRVELSHDDLSISVPVEELLQIDEALDKLGSEDPLATELVKLRYFAGLSVDEAAKIMGISRATAYRHWAYARAWLGCEIRGTDGEP